VTKEEFLSFHDQCTAKMRAITEAKGHDYSSGNYQFGNFEVVAACGICSAETGFLTRMMDKMCRVTSFVSQGVLKVKDESVEDTLLDLANYSILLAAYIKHKRGQNVQSPR